MPQLARLISHCSSSLRETHQKIDYIPRSESELAAFSEVKTFVEDIVSPAFGGVNDPLGRMGCSARFDLVKDGFREREHWREDNNIGECEGASQ